MKPIGRHPSKPITLGVIVTLTSIGLPVLPAFGQSPDPIRTAFVQIPVEADRISETGTDQTLFANRYVIGSRLVVGTWDTGDLTPSFLTEEFAAAADPAFNHDGTRLIFAGKKDPTQPFQIWELQLQDGSSTLLVAGEADCVQPLVLPDRSIVYASPLAGEYEEHGGLQSFSLYSSDPTTETRTRLTFNPSSDFDPALLPDGRIVYSAWQHVGNHAWPRGMVALMLVNSDGTGVFPLTGNHQGSWLKRGVRYRGNQSLVFVQAEQERDFAAGALMETSLNDSFATYGTLVPNRTHEVEGAAALEDGRLLVSARPLDGSLQTFGLYVLEPDGTLTLLYDDPKYHELSPALGWAGPRQDQRISTVVPGTEYGYLLTLDCGETDRVEAELLRREDIQTVRLIEGLPLRSEGRSNPVFAAVEGRDREPLINPSSATGFIPGRILGEVSPAPDGSIYMKVPADRPLRIQLVDHDGFTIMNEKAWFWVRPNERRVCIGCHENRELSPANAAPLAALAPPVDMTDPRQWRTVTFEKDIEPILRTNCAKSNCHVPPRPTAGMNLSGQTNGAMDAPMSDRYGPAYANLLARQAGKPYAVGGRRVQPGNARQSPMLWMLYGRVLGKQYAPAPFERPLLDEHPDRPLAPSDLALIRTWIDLGALYDDSTVPDTWPTRESDLSHSTQDTGGGR